MTFALFRNIEPQPSKPKKANVRGYYEEHKESLKVYRARYEREHRGENKIKLKAYRIRLKVGVFKHYSGGGKPTCSCCGETHIEFLTIDHIQGGGKKHRLALSRNGDREIGGTKFYQWLKNNNFPSGYRVLCFNCNAAKGMFGKCPHTEETGYGIK